MLFLVDSCIPARQWTDICNTRCSILSRFSYFHVSHFPPLQHGATFSCPAISCLAFSASPAAGVPLPRKFMNFSSHGNDYVTDKGPLNGCACVRVCVLYVDVVHDVVADAEPLLVPAVSPDEAKSNSRSACRPRHDPGTTAESRRPSDKSGTPRRPAVRFADPTPAAAAAAGRGDVRDAATSTMTVSESANSVSAGGGTQHHRHHQQQ